jgi:hypothetical protein
MSGWLSIGLQEAIHVIASDYGEKTGLVWQESRVSLKVTSTVNLFSFSTGSVA